MQFMHVSHHVLKLLVTILALYQMPGTLYVLWSRQRELIRQGIDISHEGAQEAYWTGMAKVLLCPPYFAAKRIWADFTRWFVGSNHQENSQIRD